ncbi:MAG: maleate cis-trans isomerase family protein [Thermoleophilaceae bacterium]
MPTWGSDVPERIGLLVPHTNTVMEPDLTRALAGSASLHVARMLLSDITLGAERQMVGGARAAAEALAGARPQVAVFGCTSAAAVLGSTGEKQVLAQLSSVAGCPVLSVNACIGGSAAIRDAEEIALLTPYREEVTRAVATRLEEEGLRVVRTRSLGLIDNHAVADLPLRQIAHEITAMRRERCDAVVVSCTNLRAVEAAELADTHGGPPIVTSNSAVIEHLRESLREPSPR